MVEWGNFLNERIYFSSWENYHSIEPPWVDSFQVLVGDSTQVLVGDLVQVLVEDLFWVMAGDYV